ncbi:precorrin-2 C(20)-methyltransferase [Candidatus Contendibacter odensensis]|uniref:Cobalamin biosynthesis precorrin-2 methyltransferase n=1 Tax=Candidatus Contendobacter odensis Run_B_J11 TaxID=1400861 RepID=A0A7U7G8N4_9GAMM|nr:precorrin-2 C(20)-methyltransferase [Candidatus Contendobacter odensis]CDH43555.1 putative Cobalamin biosynthesis precorrin-2 methyltransferase [Candidatus Contendobacter odensis Run_B_J11]
MNSTGTLYGVGVGPGDPELLTLKAVRILQSVPVIAYPATPQGSAQARDIAAQWLDDKREIPIAMPCMLDRGPVNQGYDEAALVIAEELAAGQDVAILCEGDPLFYGSFSYLLQRLGDRFPCVVIPGINSVSAAAAAAATPLITGEQRLTVIPATAGDEVLRRTLLDSDSVAILKPGRHRPRLLELLRETGRADDVLYIEQASRTGQRIIESFEEIPATPGPYFALFLVVRAENRLGTGLVD